MADTSIDVTAGTGTSVDTRTEGTNGNHRQVVVLGDPATNAGVAPVDGTAGLKVDLGTDNDVTVTGTVDLGATDNAVLDTIDAVLDAINAKLVTGTVIGDVNLGATDNAVLDDIATQVTTVAGAVSTEMQVDVVAPLPAGTNNIGDVDVATLPGTVASDITAIKTAVEILDNAITGSEMQVDIVSAPTLTVDLGANNDVQGDVAHDAADSGNPNKIGAKAVAFDGTAPGTDVAENDRTDLKATVDGRLLVETAHPNYWSASSDYAVAQTNATVKAAPGASLKLYITDVIVSNGATAGNITLLDGSGGSVLLELYPAVNGGLTHSFKTPIALTANTLLAITSTTVTTHSVTVSGFIAA